MFTFSLFLSSEGEMNNGDAMVTTDGEKRTVQLLFCVKWIKILELHPLSELIRRF